MGHLSTEAKEAIILKAINRGETRLEAIAKNNNVGVSTLQRWLRNYQNGQPLGAKQKYNKVAKEVNHSEQFKHILATAKLDEVSLGKYCREHGLYSHQIEKWQTDFMKPKQEVSNTQQQLELKELKVKYEKLKRELYRKDKALAEASALLVMKKKADLIWGVDEED